MRVYSEWHWSASRLGEEELVVMFSFRWCALRFNLHEPGLIVSCGASLRPGSFWRFLGWV